MELGKNRSINDKGDYENSLFPDIAERSDQYPNLWIKYTKKLKLAKN